MLKLKWHSVTITTNAEANNMIQLFNTLQPSIGAFDTETTGLHIRQAQPFLFQFGFINPNLKEGYTYAVDIQQQPDLARQVIRVWNQLATTLKYYMGHNVKFDLHMLANYGEPYCTENLTDTMFYIRYGHDALTPANGGPPLGLKDYASQYLDPTAKTHEKLLRTEQSAIAKELNIKLKNRLKVCGLPPAKYTAKSYTLSVIDDIFSDVLIDVNDLPTAIQGEYRTWLNNDVPDYLRPKITRIVESDMIRYDMLNRTNVIKYAHYDIVYTLETFLSLEPVIQARNNYNGIIFENSLIIPLFEMERVGFKVNKAYIEECKTRMKNYISLKRNNLYFLAEMEISIGQHALIKSILSDLFNIECISTGADELSRLQSDLIREGSKPTAVQFIDLVQELRTLEKWYATYILRFLRDLQNSDRLYTTINQVGTVSGRVTSDFQQFPKDAIVTSDGVELFHPRKMVTVSGGDYDAIVYIDFSQVELRFQAFYTILVGHPDTNLCRAYMPYKCINSVGVVFDYNNPEHIVHWADDWFLEESPETKWEPLDVHAATTEKATGLSKTHPDFKGFRSSIGKRVNFAKNYGAQYRKIREMFPERTDEECKRIDAAYYEAFPGVKMYHQYCYNRANESSYTTNLFDVKYYGVNGHKLINMLIQGGSAYYLKWKIRELYDYSKANNIKSKFQMTIHDELSWEKHKDDPIALFYTFQNIMQDWPETLVPITAELEVTTTTWAEKKGVSHVH